MKDLTKLHHLSQFEEAAGVLHEIIVEDDILVAHIGKIHFALPLNLEQNLRPLIGQRVAVLRTDLPNKSYLYRVLAQDGEQSKQ
jgi:hypothetical protein